MPPQLGSAAQYLEMDAFERLSRVPPSANEQTHPPPSTLHTSSSKRPPSPSHTPQQTSHARPSSAPPRTANNVNINSGGFNNNGGDHFQDFLQRQQDHVLKIQRKKDRITRERESVSQPTLCARSRQIAVQMQGDFLARLARDSQKKTQKDLYDEECTFQPKILPSSKMRRPRTIEEMSIGDKLKHDAHIEEMKQKIEGDEFRDVTFKPKTTSFPAESRLKILSDPDSYLERVHKEQELREEQYAEWVLQQEKKKLEDCTFQPRIHDAPSYVKRIARSMALARGDKNNNSHSSVSLAKKPEWV